MEFLTLENFLWLQAGVVVIGAFYILRRGSPSGTRFRWTKRAERILPEEMSRAPQMWAGRAPSPVRANSHHSGAGAIDSRSLNIHFNYNGHSWDAYEALGLPAGATISKAEEAHALALSRTDPSSKEFYDHALDAIRRHLKSN